MNKELYCPSNLTHSVATCLQETEDINIVYSNGKTFIECVLNRTDALQQRDDILLLLANPKLRTSHLSIQDILVEQYLRPAPKNFTPEQYKTFITRFDLLKSFSFVKKEDTTYWLSIFLQKNNRYLFDLSYEYHPDFKEALQIKDNRGNGLIHDLCIIAINWNAYYADASHPAKLNYGKTISNLELNKQINSYIHILNIILGNNPYEIYTRNKDGDNALNLILYNYEHTPYNLLESIRKYLTTYELKYKLEHHLKIDNTISQKNKI